MTDATVRMGHFGLGIIGFGLLRQWYDPASAPVRTEELRFLLGMLEEDSISPERLPNEVEVVDGYTRWAVTYDRPGNPLIDVEEPILRDLLGGPVAPGQVAVDAACGTGRVTAILADLGYDVVGVDATEAMLAIARDKVPGAAFEAGVLESLPVEDGVADVTTCTLALAHVVDLGPAVAELARVTKPGGRVLLSDLHPFALVTGGTAAFPGDEGEFPFVASYVHHVGEQLAVFASAGLVVERCEEPVTDPIIPTLFPEPLHPAATAAFGGLPFALLWSLRKAA